MPDNSEPPLPDDQLTRAQQRSAARWRFVFWLVMAFLVLLLMSNGPFT